MKKKKRKKQGPTQTSRPTKIIWLFAWDPLW